MTATPANSAYNVDELTYQLKLSKAKAIITEKNALKDAVVAAKNVGIDEKCILVVEEATGGFHCWKDILVRDEKIALETNDPNSLALLCFSSGTTGIFFVSGCVDDRFAKSCYVVPSECRCCRYDVC
jgi:4-coumarate--CoA ligase